MSTLQQNLQRPFYIKHLLERLRYGKAAVAMRREAADLIEKMNEDSSNLSAQNSYQAMRIEELQRDLAAAQAAIERLKGALKLANDSCRSAYQVAARKGIETDWESLQFSLQKSLNEQHRVMFPEQYTEAMRIHAHAHPKEGT